MKNSFEIVGGKKLFGKLRIQTSKNATLPILSASLLCDEEVTITDVPKITDVDTTDDEIKVKCDSTTYTYKLDGSCDFDLNDDDYDDDFDGIEELFDDAEDDDKYVYIEFKLNKDGEVTDIEVTEVD